MLLWAVALGIPVSWVWLGSPQALPYLWVFLDCSHRCPVPRSLLGFAGLLAAKLQTALFYWEVFPCVPDLSPFIFRTFLLYRGEAHSSVEVLLSCY